METKKKKDGRMQPAKKALIVAGALLVGGTLAYTGYKLLTKPKPEEEDKSALPSSSQTSIIPASYNKPSRNDNFPLKRGSLGNRVRILQAAIQKIIGKEAYPDTEIDGDFGPRTESAVVKAKFPVIITEDIFNKIISTSSQGAVQMVFNPRVISASLFRSAATKDLDGVLLALKKINNTAEYSQVNEYFKSAQVFTVSKSIVTYLLDVAFVSDSDAKEEIKNEFNRIGLKLDADTGKWSLSGFRLHNDIKTIGETWVLDRLNRKILVKGNTILGEKINTGNGMTWFKSIDGKIYSVPTARVKNA